jgi:hypothetical protein
MRDLSGDRAFLTRALRAPTLREAIPHQGSEVREVPEVIASGG